MPSLPPDSYREAIGNLSANQPTNARSLLETYREYDIWVFFYQILHSQPDENH